MKWILAAVFVCCYGFFRELRPSEAFISVTLSTAKNLTIEEINGEIYPLWTYSYLAGLVPVLLLTDYINYKPVLILDSMLVMMKFALMIWTDGLIAMMIMQVCSGLAYASDVGYYSILYSLVDKHHFKTVASLTSLTCLLSKFLASLSGQLLVSFDVLHLKGINVISFASAGISLIFVLWVPRSKSLIKQENIDVYVEGSNTSAKKELEVEIESPYIPDTDSNDPDSQSTLNAYDNGDMNLDDEEIDLPVVVLEMCSSVVQGTSVKDECNNNNLAVDQELITKKPSGEDTKQSDSTELYNNNDKIKLFPKETKNKTILKKQHNSICHIIQKLFKKLLNLKDKMKSAYSNRTVLIWSLWSIFGTCGNFQNGKYIQNLWEVISPYTSGSSSYNGGTKAVGVLLGAIFVALIGFVRFDWSRTGRSEFFMVTVSALKAVSYVLMAQTGNIWLAYVLYVVIKSIVPVSLTLQSAEIARALSGSNCAFVFGCNLFLGVTIESLFTVVVIHDAGIGVNVRTQFLVYGVYYSIHAVAFIGVALATVVKKILSARPSPGFDYSTLHI